MSNQQYEYGRPSPGNLRKLKELLLKSDNRTCADCGAPDPKWASANIGVFICLKCCGVHRSLGTHISKVLSVTLDDWSDDEIDFMSEVGGNISANAIYEAYLPKGFSKPGPNSSHEERMNFIRSKYELQEFLKPSLRIASFASAMSSLNSSDSGKNMDSFRVMSKKTVGMVEFIGLLKVKVIKGTNLAIRDMRSSDPYVIVNIGQQQVFDHDTFSADDIMGEAEIDIQPLVAAATAFEDVDMYGNMQIGKWLKSADNALVRDSTINIIDGKVKQEVSLKLQNVESGEVDVELEWMPLDQ
ncbi:ADP-ribosylation factor GTPase-activating protein AGD12-like isoform X2 [Magnolia sinica]|uniref:ADP-ribosylation factor GTPase-activating protein AGD12-like isoform X2 n=1 Tax=Magnolia sinica TaxID=86752 RepID=UPI002658CF5F|nr:ADP-ribosylation factor GTPase-activating protein AGD12-like isoform X2 [Magnolia sinica]